MHAFSLGWVVFVTAERLCRIVDWCVVQQPLEAYLLQGIGAVGRIFMLACLPFMEEVICAPSALSSTRSSIIQAEQ